MSEQSQHIHINNTNRWSTRQMVTMALMAALGAILMYVQIPLIPAAPFLTYDPSLVPAIVCAFAYGPVGGISVAGIAIVLHALTTGDWVGALMNLIASLGYILPAALAYKKLASRKGAIVSLVCGVVGGIVFSVIGNLTVGVLFWYGSTSVIIPLLVPAILPFNFVKGAVNSVLTVAVYGVCSTFMAAEKKRAGARA